MTAVVFYSEGSRLTGFKVSGHSDYADEGADIVCAAVTSAVRLTECAVNDVLGLKASVKVGKRNASVTLKLPGGLGEENEALCQTLLAALMTYLCSLQEEFPDYLTVQDLDGADEQS